MSNIKFKEILIIAQSGTWHEFLKQYKDKFQKLQKKNEESLLVSAMANHNAEDRFKIVNFLIDKGYDVNCIGSEGHSLLHILFSRPNQVLEQTVLLSKRLIELNIDLNLQDQRKRTILHFMIEMGFTDEELNPLYDVVFSKDNINLKLMDNWKHTALDFAEIYGSRRKKLLERMIKYDKKKIY